MQRNAVKQRGSPHPTACKLGNEGTAKSTSIVYEEKVNRVPGSDLLTRTIACRPPNEDRIRGIAA
jgi:hypothetical protein